MLAAAAVAHYSLDVQRVTDVRHRSRSHSFYVKIECDGRTLGDYQIKDDGSSISFGILTFSSTDNSPILGIRVVKRERVLRIKTEVGCVNVRLVDLWNKCTDTEAPVEVDVLSSSGLTASHLCSVYLFLERIDETKRAEIDVQCVPQNIERIELSAKIADSADAVGSVVEVVDRIVEAISHVVENIHPYLNLAWKATTALYRIVSHQWETDKKLIDLVDVMMRAYEFAKDVKTLGDGAKKLTEPTDRLLRHTIAVCFFVKEYTSRSFIERILRIASRQKVDKYKEGFIVLRRDLDAYLAVHTASTAGYIRDKVEKAYDIGACPLSNVDRFQAEDGAAGMRQQFQVQEQRLQELKELLEPIRSDVFNLARCLPNTRMEYLRKIKDWLFSPPEENILWLNGIAGSGKSTIAASITDHCDDESCLAAFLFFERGKEEHRSIIRTIAYQLAAFEPSLASHIIPAAKRLKSSSPARQFEKLLLNPLRSVKDVKGPIIIIIDALDECGTAEQRREILELLKVNFANLPLDVRFFITSRPENDILRSLASRPHIRELKLDPASTESRRDVLAYIDNAMLKAVADPVPDGFAWTVKMNILGRAADGLFIWASTAVKMVMNSDDPFGKLDGLVSNVHSLNGLDNLYATVLEQSGISWEDPKSVERFGKVLGLILFGKITLSEDDVDKFLGIGQGKSRLTLQNLRSVLFYEPGQSIRLHHTSFADYLLSRDRSGNRQWFIDANSQRRTIALRCLTIMSELLHLNICNLETPAIKNDDIPGLEGRVARYIPRQLSYACLFWSEHLCDLPNSEDMVTALQKFAYRNLLYWFEVLSLTNHFTRFACRALMDAVLWFPLGETETSSFLWDAYKLATVFSYPIAQSAPHIYLSMLSLSEDESAVTKHYRRTHPTIHFTHYGIKPPNPCLKILSKGPFAGFSVAFSPDGRRVCGSYRRRIRIWNADSGEVITVPSEEHGTHVFAVAFSPDGKLVVSGCRDGTIRIWDAESGKTVTNPSEKHNDAICSVAFSLCGKHIVTGSDDCTIRIWDVKCGRVVKLLNGHDAGVTSVSFSPDGQRVVSGSRDCTIRIWDAESGEVVEAFRGHSYGVLSVAFSPNGDRIASGSEDCAIQIWDVQTGERVAGPFEGHGGSVASVAFSPDGKRVASGSGDKTIRIWDAESGKCLAGPFEGHTGNVMSVAFSPDGKRIVSSSSDNTIRIWHAELGKVPTSSLEWRRLPISSVSLSPDGVHVATGCEDGKIWIWDGDVGQTVAGPFEVHTDRIHWIAFTREGKRVVSFSNDNTLWFLNVESGEAAVEPFTPRPISVQKIFALSPDGKSVAAACDDGTIRISGGGIIEGPFGFRLEWDEKGEFVLLPSGEYVAGGSGRATTRDYKPVIANGEIPISLAFSPDGRRLVSGSNRGKIVVLDIQTGTVVAAPFVGHQSSVDSVVFLSDIQYIASASKDGTFRIWDVKNNNVVAGPVKVYEPCKTNSISFSPDGERVAFGSFSGSIRIWDVRSGEAITELVGGHGGSITLLAFSLDGKRVLSQSFDDIIRIWNIEAELQALYKSEIAEGVATSFDRPSDSWHLSEDGWVLGKGGELLTWIPADLRNTLWRPRTTAILNCQFSTRLDFAKSLLGKDWTKGYVPRKFR
ncbi:WD40 repeat-like protein [Fomitiporia mediterranea MF3/22]|uniref:WD40 repeat-like protein n=1 Tax=Fomitiporia mediterranea (strain MF3/22) TaxID=694068 RepID=UPI00044080E2|nr:WD40 repeat-like protein [Fomitiporia mediterranea MF3/22]EJC99178.1 WD40 repeat-like protein [Fomitiporia mediterranea MF3/22]